MKFGRIYRIVIVLAWLAASIFCVVRNYEPRFSSVWENLLEFDVLLGPYIIATWALCWVGFPIGWKIFRPVREAVSADNQWLWYSVSFIAGLLAMCMLSIPAAAIQAIFWNRIYK